MRYHHRFRVDAPLEAVAQFHRSPAGMASITPPPIGVDVEMSPATLTEGSRMAFTLKVGPLSIYWVARIEELSPTGFVDRQLRGPFRSWVHRHSFRPLGPGTTEVVDEVSASPRSHPLWGPVALGMWVSLPLLFAYRGWKIRRLLEGRR